MNASSTVQEIIRLISKAMSNIYLFANVISWSVFDKLLVTQILLNLETFCWSLKITGLGAKVCATFLLFLFWKDLWRFEIKKPMLFVDQKSKLW